MSGSRLGPFAGLVAAGVAVALALPVPAPAHQLATLSGGVMTITGDQEHNGQPKPNDLVTIDYDAGAHELVFGQDVFGPHPSGCSPDAAHPQRIIHCPASLISAIQINSGAGNDEVDANLPADMTIQVSTGAGNDSFSGRAEADDVNLGSGSDKADGGAGNDTLRGGSGSDKLMGGLGVDSLFGGTSPDKLFGGAGRDLCKPGPGAGKERSC